MVSRNSNRRAKRVLLVSKARACRQIWELRGAVDLLQAGKRWTKSYRTTEAYGARRQAITTSHPSIHLGAHPEAGPRTPIIS